VTTIEDLEGERWPDPAETDTTLVRRCLTLRRKQLKDFTIEDLRIMLGQQIAVPILLPRAVEVLVRTPLAAGDYYPGDLLHAVIRLPDEVWRAVPDMRRQLADAIGPLTAFTDVHEHLRSAIQAFVGYGREP
jgi:hypothetical protein